MSAEDAQAYAAENGLYHLETSAKTAANVNDLFQEIAARLPKAEAISSPPQAGIVLSQNAQPAATRAGTCC